MSVSVRRVLPLIVLCLLVSAILGGLRMRELSFWYDEVASVDFTRDLIGTLQRFPDQMPAYFIMLGGWLSLVGESEVAGRWLSLLFGLLALATTFRLARRHASLRVAILSLIVLGTSSIFVRYYREMRTYTFLACFASASMWFYLEWLRRARRRDAFAYVVVTGVMAYTHFFAGLVVAAQGFYTLLTMFGQTRTQVPPLYEVERGSGGEVNSYHHRLITIGLHAIIGLLLLPYLGVYFAGLNWVTTGGKHPAALTTPQAIDSLTRALTNGSLALFIMLILAALITRYRPLLIICLMWLAIPVFAVLFVHAFVVRVFVNPRYLLFVWPPMAVLLALGIDSLDRYTARAAIGVVAIIGIVQVITNFPATLPGVLTDQPWRDVFTIIHDDGKPTDIVIVNMVDPTGLTAFREPFAYYSRRYRLPGMNDPIELDVPPSPPDLDQRFKQASGVWMLVTDGDPNAHGQDAIRTMRDSGLTNCRKWTYHNNTSLTEWRRMCR
jgi:uncharacterized membrane protein